MLNSAAATATITNYGLLRGPRRMQLTLGAGHGADLGKVKQVLERIYPRRALAARRARARHPDRQAGHEVGF